MLKCGGASLGAVLQDMFFSGRTEAAEVDNPAARDVPEGAYNEQEGVQDEPAAGSAVAVVKRVNRIGPPDSDEEEEERKRREETEKAAELKRNPPPPPPPKKLTVHNAVNIHALFDAFAQDHQLTKKFRGSVFEPSGVDYAADNWGNAHHGF